MSESEEHYYAKCYDCGTTLSARETVKVPVHMDKPDGGYDRVPMPACRHCRLKRHGHECDHCGELHETALNAYECCVGRTKAPDCLECGRRMEVTAAGYGPIEGQTITVAECECCPVLWGRYTGWEQTGGELCKHIETDRSEASE